MYLSAVLDMPVGGPQAAQIEPGRPGPLPSAGCPRDRSCGPARCSQYFTRSVRGQTQWASLLIMAVGFYGFKPTIASSP